MDGLPIPEILSGIDAAIDNAGRFHSDANYLAANGRLLSAALLAIYAYDELGKASLILVMTLAPDRSPQGWRTFRKALTTHGSKFNYVGTLVAKISRISPNDDVAFKEEVVALTNLLVELRKRCAFVELEGGVFSKPSERLDSQCRWIVEEVGKVVAFFHNNRAAMLQTLSNREGWLGAKA